MTRASVDNWMTLADLCRRRKAVWGGDDGGEAALQRRWAAAVVDNVEGI